MLRPFKCTDPVMLYKLVYVIFMACRFDAVARYVKGFAYGFKPGEPFNAMLHLKVLDPLHRLANHLRLTDKQGHQLVFLYSKDDVTEWQRTISKTNWQKKHADNPPVAVNLYEIFSCDEIVRLSWRLETHLFELKTIDRLITAGEGSDPEYRKDYRFKRIQCCATSYEQAMLNNTVYCNRLAELPQRMRQYVDYVRSRKSIDPRRKPKPVVCFNLHANRDKRGNIIYDKDGLPDYTPVFNGIWNSAYEADIETDIPWRKIRKSVELKAVNDGYNNVWLSLEDYISMTYNSLSQARPEIAAQFKAILPEFEMQTCQQIAASTRAPQGTFIQSVFNL